MKKMDRPIDRVILIIVVVLIVACGILGQKVYEIEDRYKDTNKTYVQKIQQLEKQVEQQQERILELENEVKHYKDKGAN